MSNQRWQMVLSAVLGVWVIISPWLFLEVASESVSSAASWSLWLSGAAVAVLSLAALVNYRTWQEWVTAALGAWLVASPWIFDFAGMTALTISTVVAGGAVLILSGITAISAPEAA